MTSDDLNQLFASTRDIPVETAPEQIAGWVGTAAAASTGVLGVSGKLKLFIAKKTFLFMGTILSIASLGVIVTMSLSSTEAPKESTSGNESISVVGVDAKEQQESKMIPITFDDTLPTPPPPVPPIAELQVAPPAPAANPIPTAAPISPMPVQAPKIDVPSKRKRSKSRKRAKSAPAVQKEFTVDAFTKLKISGLMDVVLIQGNETKVKFEINPEMEQEFNLNSENGELVIGFDDEMFAKDASNTVYVTFKNLEELIFSGVGNITTEGKINLDNLLCKASGVGDIELDMDCKNLEVKFTGVGDIDITGSGDLATYSWKGVGDLKASNMKMKDVAISLSGVGDAKLHATESLEVNLTGIGDVKYTG
ncbi:DUF2807 domain-containing protein [Crocinitomicaceae bacterium]|nr:DUF2807 domain-containing protein [Crocinitomicaceae bacterium]